MKIEFCLKRYRSVSYNDEEGTSEQKELGRVCGTIMWEIGQERRLRNSQKRVEQIKHPNMGR
jgi:hypothetical protein